MFANPRANVAEFGLIPGMKVADFGAGVGEYALEMARVVGDGGKIYAVEVQKGLLERLEKEARENRISNIQTIWGNIEKLGGSKLDDQSVNVVLAANILFESDAKYSLALEAKRVLRAGGWIIVIDWLESFGGLGPHPQRVVPREEVKKIFDEAGFRFRSEFPAGNHHFGLIFSKP